MTESAYELSPHVDKNEEKELAKVLKPMGESGLLALYDEADFVDANETMMRLRAYLSRLRASQQEGSSDILVGQIVLKESELRLSELDVFSAKRSQALNYRANPESYGLATQAISKYWARFNTANPNNTPADLEAYVLSLLRVVNLVRGNKLGDPTRSAPSGK